MNCLLISTLISDTRCIGLLSIYQYIKTSNRHFVKLLFLPHYEYTDEQLEGVMDFIKDHSIKAIGISLMTLNFHNCVKLTKKIKERFSDIKIVWGGIHPTLMPEECINHADYVCIGEGEIPMLELLDRLESREEAGSISNFWSKADKAVVRNEIRLFEDITHYPFPRYDWDDFHILYDAKPERFTKECYKKMSNWHGSAYSVIATRGCPFSCSYCCNSALKGKMYGNSIRRRDIDDIIKELKYVKTDMPFVKIVNFQDDCFFAVGVKWLDEFCNNYKEKIGLPFFIRTIPSYVNDEKIAMAKKAGLAGVSLGLQTGDNHINSKIYNRPISAAQFMEAAKTIRKRNIWAVYDIILNGPYDTDESCHKTAKIVSELPKPFSLNIFFMMLFPKTKLSDLCKKDGIEFKGDPYISSFGSAGQPSFYYMLMSISPVCPRFLLRYFLKRRKSRFAQRLLFKIHNLNLASKMRTRLSSFGAYSDRLVRTLFKIQSYVFK